MHLTSKGWGGIRQAWGLEEHRAGAPSLITGLLEGFSKRQCLHLDPEDGWAGAGGVCVAGMLHSRRDFCAATEPAGQSPQHGWSCRTTPESSQSESGK